MKRTENNCLGCKELGLPCLGNSCPNKTSEITYCDRCDRSVAEYHITGNDYCESCAEEYLKELFAELSIFEKADALDINLHTCE